MLKDLKGFWVKAKKPLFIFLIAAIPVTAILIVYFKFNLVDWITKLIIILAAALSTTPIIFQYIKEYDDEDKNHRKHIPLFLLFVSVVGFFLTTVSTSYAAQQTKVAETKADSIQNVYESVQHRIDSITKLNLDSLISLSTNSRVSFDEAISSLSDLEDGSSIIQNSTKDLTEIVKNSQRLNDSLRRTIGEQRLYSAYQLIIWTYDELLLKLKTRTDIAQATTEFRELLFKMKQTIENELNNEVMNSNKYIKSYWLWMNNNLTSWISDDNRPTELIWYQRMIDGFYDYHCFFRSQLYAVFETNGKFEYDSLTDKRIKRKLPGDYQVKTDAPNPMTPVANCGKK